MDCSGKETPGQAPLLRRQIDDNNTTSFNASENQCVFFSYHSVLLQELPNPTVIVNMQRFVTMHIHR